MIADSYKGKTNGELKADALRLANSNHMWINAFECIRPTDELRKAIGTWVLEKLADPECLIPSIDPDAPDDRPIHEIQRLCGGIILTFNKS